MDTETMNAEPLAVHIAPLTRLLPRRLWQAPTGAGFGPLPELLLTLTIVTGPVDALSGSGRGEVVVAVPFRLHGRIGDEVEDPLRVGGDDARDAHDSVGLHTAIKTRRHTCGAGE